MREENKSNESKKTTQKSEGSVEMSWLIEEVENWSNQSINQSINQSKERSIKEDQNKIPSRYFRFCFCLRLGRLVGQSQGIFPRWDDEFILALFFEIDVKLHFQFSFRDGLLCGLVHPPEEWQLRLVLSLLKSWRAGLFLARFREVGVLVPISGGIPISFGARSIFQRFLRFHKLAEFSRNFLLSSGTGRGFIGVFIRPKRREKHKF